MRVAMRLDNAGSMGPGRQDVGDADGREEPGRSAQWPRAPRRRSRCADRWWYSNASQIDTRQKKLRDDDAKAASIARAASTRSVR
ncbi:hypothetical protein BJS_08985 [Bradyrhizobium japonicum SEMIA 5079]|nr:hypothetical protein BJS_08985 [Bradyrhizobium japonicum SEMIA 5079]